MNLTNENNGPYLLMKIKKTSILHLIIIGYLCVILPIAISLYQGVDSLKELTKSNQRNIKTAVQVTRNCQKITNLVRDMERSIRQYRLLESPELLDIYFKYLSETELVMGHIENQLPPKLLKSLVLPFKAQIQTLKSQTNQPQLTSESIRTAILSIQTLKPLTKKIAGSGHTFADQIILENQITTHGIRERLFLKIFTVIPITIFLVIVFSSLISRPFKQLHQAIIKLGDGDFNDRFTISGPDDLKSLGSRLNWLASRLIQIEEEKMIFLRHMSHELKTPLAAIKEGGEILLDEIPGPLNQKQLEVVTIIKKSTNDFQRTIENLLDYNFLKSRKELIIEEIQFDTMINEILSTHSLTIKRRYLTINLSGPSINVMADKRLFKTALDNLISNAVSYAYNNSSIQIMWSKTSKELIFEISDEGPGVSLNELKLIFHPFYQGANQKDGAIKGSGIGLSLAQECIRAHHGELSAHKTPNGLCFKIQIPICFQE